MNNDKENKSLNRDNDDDQKVKENANSLFGKRSYLAPNIIMNQI